MAVKGSNKILIMVAHLCELHTVFKARLGYGETLFKDKRALSGSMRIKRHSARHNNILLKCGLSYLDSFIACPTFPTKLDRVSLLPVLRQRQHQLLIVSELICPCPFPLVSLSILPSQQAQSSDHLSCLFSQVCPAPPPLHPG